MSGMLTTPIGEDLGQATNHMMRRFKVWGSTMVLFRCRTGDL